MSTTAMPPSVPSAGPIDPASRDPYVNPAARAPLVAGAHGIGDVTRMVSAVVERTTPRWWWPAFLVSSVVAAMGFTFIGYLIVTGVGVWGVNQPVGWGWAIVNFVFWVGIGHAGTLISAILFLLRQKWRTSINRAAEAMTVFAVMCAGIFPAIHVGRVWRAYFMAPIPNHLDLWPNFRSPLLWDVFAVFTYATVSMMFWYVGLIPDLATFRDRARSRIKQFAYGLFALGWRGGQRQWRNYEMAYLLLAGLSTPLVLSVHSIVSFDFAISQVPGWHTTIFPPYFVAGAIFSGFAMVITLLVPARAIFRLHDLITPRHLDNICKILLATGMMVGYAYAMEFFMAWYSGNPFESFVFFISRATGPYAWAYWTMVSCNVIAPQFFWFKRIRHSPLAMFLIAIVVNIGMWFERFVITVTSLHRDALPSSWGYYSPTFVDVLTFVGTFGLFFSLFLLFLRFMPMVAMAEVKSVMDTHDHASSWPHSTPDSSGGSTEGAPFSSSTSPQLPPDHAAALNLAALPGGRSADNIAAVVARFDGPGALLEAARQVRDSGYQKFDVHTPYPVHGMDQAMGLGRSRLGWIVAVCGIAGAAVALGLQIYPSVFDYPLITGGKPYLSGPALLIITFELAVLFAALGAVGGMFVLNGLPAWYHPTLKYLPMARASDDEFFLVIEAADRRFDAQRTAGLLRSLGGQNVTAIEP